MNLLRVIWGGAPLAEAYRSFQTELLATLELAGQDANFHQYKELISRLQRQLPSQFPAEMDKRAYHWETLEGVLVNGEQKKRIFPLHYVALLVWRALNDNEAFRHNYADNSLEQAQSDLSYRLLTFYKTLDEKIHSTICSQGARHALVLCLNKIHVDVNLIEDIETALNAEFCRLLSDRLAMHSPTNPDKILHDALLGWIKDDQGALSGLTGLLGMNETLLEPFLRRHGLASHEKLPIITRYQDPSLLIMPKHQELVDALRAAYYLINENSLQALQHHQDKAGVTHEKPDTLSLLVNELDNPNTLVLFDETWQQRLIVSVRLHQLIEFLKNNQRNLLVMGAFTEQSYVEMRAKAERAFDDCLTYEAADIQGIKPFAQETHAAMERNADEARKVFIENFFAQWAVPSRDVYMRQPLYAFLWEPGNKKHIYLSDEVLRHLKPLANHSEIDVTPYELNRTLLHGLTTPVSDWSPLFTSFFQAALSLIEGGPNEAFNKSYPEDLKCQLNALLEIKQGQKITEPRPDILWHPDSSLPLQTAQQIVYVLRSLASKERALFLERISPDLPELIKTADDFKQVMYSLSPAQSTALVNALTAQLLELIKTVDDFKQVMHFLSPAQRTALINELTARLPELIKTADDFKQVMHFLSPAQRTALVNALMARLPELIKTTDDVKQVMYYLRPEQITAIVNALMARLPELIKTADDVKQVMHFLSPEQRTALVNALTARLPELIKTTDDVKQVMYFLSPEQITALCNALTVRLPELIKTTDDVKQVMYYLRPEQITALGNALTARLSELIKTIDDFSRVMCYLRPEQITALCNALTARLPELIKTTGYFNRVMCYLRPEQITALCNALTARIRELIETADDFRQVMYFLSPEQITALCNALTAQIPELIKTTDDFNRVMYYLRSEQITALGNGLTVRLPELIKTANDFEQVMYYLSPEQRTAVSNELTARLPELIKTVDDFKQVMHFLSPEQRTALGNELTAWLPELIKTADDFGWVMYYLSLEQRTVLGNELTARLPELIKTARDFDLVMQCLNPEQSTIVVALPKAPQSIYKKETENRVAFFSSSSTDQSDKMPLGKAKTGYINPHRQVSGVVYRTYPL